MDVNHVTLQRLVVDSDVLLTEDSCDGTDLLQEANPDLVITVLTSFGETGRYADYKATDLTLFQMSGYAKGMVSYVDDLDSCPPVRSGGHQAELVSGLSVAMATVMALVRRSRTGRGAPLFH